MEIGEGWSQQELASVWRELIRLPLAHVAANDGLLSLSRAAIAPEGESGERPAARYLDQVGKIVLYDSAFQYAIDRDSLGTHLFRMVGESLWRQHRRATGIDDQAEFGRLYARYYLEPEQFAKEAPGQHALIAEHVAAPGQQASTSPALIPTQAAFASIMEHPGVQQALGPQMSPVLGPPPLTQRTRSAPFVFAQFLGFPQGPDKAPQPVCAAYDGLSGEVWFRDEAGFEAFLQARQYRAEPARLSADELLTAWYVLTRGTPPCWVTDVLSEARSPLEPKTIKTREGDFVTEGWSRHRAHLERHVIRVPATGPAICTTTTSEQLGGHL